MSFIGSIELLELECFKDRIDQLKAEIDDAYPAPYQRGDKLIKDAALSRGERINYEQP